MSTEFDLLCKRTKPEAEIRVFNDQALREFLAKYPKEHNSRFRLVHWPHPKAPEHPIPQPNPQNRGKSKGSKQAPQKEPGLAPPYRPQYFNLRIEAESKTEAQNVGEALSNYDNPGTPSFCILGLNDSVFFHAAAPEPEDPVFPKQKGCFDRMKILDAWRAIPPEAKAVGVAVIDTGVFEDHEDLQAGNGTGCLEKYYGYRQNFGPGSQKAPQDVRDSDGHGTMLAGILGARRNNELGIAGILGPDDGPPPKPPKPATANLLILKVNFSFDEGAFLGQALDALRYLAWLKLKTACRDQDKGLVDQLRVVLLAWAVESPDPEIVKELRDALHELMPHDDSNGMLVVVSAGKNGQELGTGEKQLPLYPALFGGNRDSRLDKRLDNVICVGASFHADSEPYGQYYMDQRLPSSPFSRPDKCGGRCVDIFAPGHAVWSTFCNGRGEYREESGTSFAAAHVAAVAALLFAKDPSATPAEVKQQIVETASRPQPVPNPDDDVSQLCVAGGIVDSDAALKNWP